MIETRRLKNVVSFVQITFKTVATTLWKSDIIVSKAEVSEKQLGRFVRNKSIHYGLDGFLKTYGTFYKTLEVVYFAKTI